MGAGVLLDRLNGEEVAAHRLLDGLGNELGVAHHAVLGGHPAGVGHGVGAVGLRHAEVGDQDMAALARGDILTGTAGGSISRVWGGRRALYFLLLSGRGLWSGGGLPSISRRAAGGQDHRHAESQECGVDPFHENRSFLTSIP